MNCFTMMGQTLSAIYYDYTLCDKTINTYNFKYGTTVHARNLIEAKNIMKYTFSNFKGEFWANEIDDELWQVQYCNADLPSLYITVIANTGNIAAYNGYSILEKDMKEMEVIVTHE